VTAGWTAAALLAAGYLLGSIPFGVLVARGARGVDVRTQGSGNIGATNVARLAGARLGLVVLALDAGKGALAVWLAQRWLPEAEGVQALAGLSAFAGHVAPVWLRFRGGKGVATALGVLAVLVPWAATAAAAAYGLVFLWTRISSLGSLVAGPVAVAAAAVHPGTRLAVGLTGTLWLATLWTHRGNIRRLVRHLERRL
jgi:acyl phosphate:glycerol-3-phosphate acyltransferase